MAAAGAAAGAGVHISAEEAAVYDRQIRVWGMEAQKRMRGSAVFVVGARGLSAEICKNIALAGIGALTLVDDQVVTAADLSAQFFLTEADIGKNRAEASVAGIRALNPNVTVTADRTDPRKLDAAFVQRFSILVVTDQPVGVQLQLNALCRANAAKPVHFLSAATFGFVGVAFSDLIEHKFVVSEKKKDPKTGDETEDVQSKAESFAPLSQVLTASWKRADVAFGKKAKPIAELYLSTLVVNEFFERHRVWPDPDTTPAHAATAAALRDQLIASASASASSNSTAAKADAKAGAAAAAASGVGVAKGFVSDAVLQQVVRLATCELNTTVAVFGALCGQEVLKVLSGRDAPHKNVIVYDANSGAAIVREIA